MSDELLPFYNRELSYLRRLGAEFADAYPKIAGRLRLGPDASEDPHVERLIEAVAYLNARVRRKIEDDFPEITDALLDVLYPHYRAPIPSMSIVQLELDAGQNELTTGYDVPRHTAVETEPIDGEPVRFRTCYPVTLWPIELKSAQLLPPPFTAPTTPRSAQAAAVLRLVFVCRADAVRFAQLSLDSIRLFLKGQAQHVYLLYELLLNNTLEVALANKGDDPNPVLLDRGSLRPVGFGRDDGLLPYSARSLPGYGLLSEFFTFPEKFLFVELEELTPTTLREIGNELEVYVYLNRTSADLAQNLSADTFRLGCTPVVNLYRQRAEPIPLTHLDHEYRIAPDARRPLAHEVYSIDKVMATSPDGETLEFLPFFSVKHSADRQAAQAFWFASRRAAAQLEGRVDPGTDVYLSLVDLGFKPSVPADWTLDVETTCLSRDLPGRLPFGGDQPRLQLSEGFAAVSRAICLTPPTRTFRPALGYGGWWKLISSLSLNHLSIVESVRGGEALREIVSLYNFADSDETRGMIAGILDVGSRRVVGRVRGENGDALCRGIEVTVHFDERRFSGSGLFLFASVLERFLGLYVTLNSFTKLIATVEGRKGELRRWPPRMGEKTLI